MQDPSVVDDASVIRRIQSGNAIDAAEAMTELFNQYNPQLLRYLRSRGLVPQECDDVANETWTRAWRAIDKYEDRGAKITTWLIGIAKNVMKELFRKRYVGLPLEETEAVEKLALPDPAQVVLTTLTRQEINDAIKNILPEATEDFRKIIECWYFCEFTTEEIMSLYDWSSSKVYTTKFRALLWLKDRLNKQYGANAIDSWLHQ